MRSLMLFSLVLVSAATQAVEIKGFVLGSTRQELKDKWPQLWCSKPDPKWNITADEVCSDASGRLIESYAGAAVKSTHFLVLEGRVEAFRIYINPENYSQIHDALVEKHAGGADSSRSLQTRAGVRIESRRWRAAVDGGVLALDEHSERLDQGVVAGDTSAMLLARARRLIEAPKKNSNDL